MKLEAPIRTKDIDKILKTEIKKVKIPANYNCLTAKDPSIRS